MGGFNVFHLAIWYVVFVLSATVHEAAHALAALRLGDPTAHRGGQVSLNPVPHIRRERNGMVIVPILSFMVTGQWMLGWASAPYDPDWAWRFPKRKALMSLVGPMANLCLFILSFLLIRAGLGRGVFTRPDVFRFVSLVDGSGLWSPVAMFLSVCFVLNLLLAVLNLIPLPPFDGSSVVMFLLDENTARRWMLQTQQRGFVIVTLIVVFFAFGLIFSPIFRMAYRALFFNIPI